MQIDIMFISEIIGLIGVALVISSYFLLQQEIFSSDSSGYLCFNLVGSLMLLFSLYYNWNLASVVIECLWFIITVYGIVKFKILRKS